jgi:hypothetical protein
MKTLLLVLAVFLLLCAAPAYCADNLGCGADMTGAQCLAGNSADNNIQGMSGTNYLSCFAVGRWYQTCQESFPTGVPGVSECVSVQRSAKCFCDENTKRTSGLCTYQAR